MIYLKISLIKSHITKYLSINDKKLCFTNQKLKTTLKGELKINKYKKTNQKLLRSS